MNMNKRRVFSLVLAIVFLFVINSGFNVVDMDAIENNNEVEDSEMYFKTRDSDVEKQLYTMLKNPRTKKTEPLIIGKVSINHNESEFLIYIEPYEEEGWQISSLRIFVGHDKIPIAGNKKPITARFPFKKSFSKPVKSQLVTIDLYEDLGLTWLPQDADKMLQNVAINCSIKGVGEKGKVLNIDAWAGNVVPEDTDGDGDIDADDEFVQDNTFVADLSSGTSFQVEVTDKIFRKNVSKMPETATTKAKIELLPVYVPARRANGEPVQLEYNSYENIESETPVVVTETRTEVKPLVAVYAEEVAGCEIPPIYEGETPLARDVYAAISRDEGNTWKRTNLSRSAERDFEFENGLEYRGDTHKPNIKIQGNTFLIAWTSKYASSGTPTYAISEYLKYKGDWVLDENGEKIPNPAYQYHEEDIWGVSGPQRSKDYTDDGYPGVEIPFSVVWVNRGYIDPGTGDIILFKAERLTSGRRDAAQITIASGQSGFGLVWQEDPEGLRAGEMAGPGEGWSGATTNHNTDIWYSFISAGDFKKIDVNYVSNGDPSYDEDDPDKGDGRPKALVPMKLPIRLTDNEVLNSENMKIDPSKLIDDGEGFKKLSCADLPYIDDDDNPVNVAPDTGDSETPGEGEGDGSGDGNGDGDSDGSSNNPLGSHIYGYKLPGLLWTDNNSDGLPEADDYIRFYETVNKQGVTKYVAITVDGRLMDGDTGAARGNLMLQGKYAVLGYEETKGAGAGPPEHDEEGGNKPEDGTGSGSDAYVSELGKNVVYHFFDYDKPVKVAGGEILNPQEVDADGNPVYLENEDGTPIVDYLGNPVPAYENARRPRFLIQGKDNALNSEYKTSMVALYKMGEEGKGRPSDIIMNRWVIDDYDSAIHPNPYDTHYLERDTAGLFAWQNISSVTVEEVEEYTNDSEEARYKLLKWSQHETNLNDSTTTPYTAIGQEGWDNDDARAHRGFLRGDFLAVAYCWTPNWTAARNGNDVYNLYIRRSFNGGANWTTDPNGSGITASQIYRHDSTYAGEDDKHYEETYDVPAGEFEPARNVSLLRNNKETVIEPRLVGVPGTTLTNGVAKYPEDVQDPNSFWVTYGTHASLDTKIPKDSEDEEEEGGPLDLYYSYSTDKGETYYTVDKTIKIDSDGGNGGETVTVWDWLAKDTGKLEAEQAECQIRMTPDGSRFYAVWNEAGTDSKTGEYSSDVMFRRIDRNYGFIVSTPLETAEP